MPPKFVYLCCLSLSYTNLIKANNLLLLDLFKIKTLGVEVLAFFCEKLNGNGTDIGMKKAYFFKRVSYL